ncbi:uncharacterized protein BXZ73DRAFT_97840 [Epithele typhae]|uniref:uncharacterized protein n=1 Tax=Epithele typhae TaxID=378194 RepID=UPI0020074799|nr:uncharacterized protein BXZ73DRAFT_97840 [Epithele typhae]KAH9942429.1 hypothetical protein BXZ73DRAFT_97840 [Epithele typhae]
MSVLPFATQASLKKKSIGARNFEYQVRKLLPASRLPDCLNPLRTLASPRDLPLCWFGVPLRRDIFFKGAIKLGVAKKIPGTEDWLWPHSFYALRDAFEKVRGVYFDMEQVWGASARHPQKPIVAFFSNRAMKPA